MPKQAVADGAQKSAAPALTRGLKVLELLATTDSPQSLTAIARHLGIAMSSAHALCTTLRNESYVEKRSDGSFQLTLKVLDLASSKINKYDIVEHFYEACDEMPLIRENASVISVLDGQDVFYIGTRNSPQPLGVTFKVGMRLPACCTATGRAMLANLSDDEVCRIYPDELLPQVTKASLRKRTELLDILKRVRKEGHAEELATTRPHMYSYGALVATPSGKTIAGVAVSLYEGDVTKAVERGAIKAIRELAQRLSRFGELLT
jgi:IclR family transcriptional regulator, blcABC operon repressor